MSWSGIRGWFGFRETYDEMVDQCPDGGTLVEIGVGAEHAAPLSLMAEVDPSAGTNPIKLTAANCEQLYRRAMEGVLSRTA